MCGESDWVLAGAEGEGFEVAGEPVLGWVWAGEGRDAEGVGCNRGRGGAEDDYAGDGHHGDEDWRYAGEEAETGVEGMFICWNIGCRVLTSLQVCRCWCCVLGSHVCCCFTLTMPSVRCCQRRNDRLTVGESGNINWVTSVVRHAGVFLAVNINACSQHSSVVPPTIPLSVSRRLLFLLLPLLTILATLSRSARLLRVPFLVDQMATATAASVIDAIPLPPPRDIPNSFTASLRSW